MIYVKSIKLKNFTTIREAELDTDNRVIVISGKSGQGKSAIMEAMRIVFSSKKRSDRYNEYILQGKDRAEVIIQAVVAGVDTEFRVDLNYKRGGAFDLTVTQGEKNIQGIRRGSIFRIPRSGVLLEHNSQHAGRQGHHSDEPDGAIQSPSKIAQL